MQNKIDILIFLIFVGFRYYALLHHYEHVYTPLTTYYKEEIKLTNLESSDRKSEQVPLVF